MPTAQGTQARPEQATKRSLIVTLLGGAAVAATVALAVYWGVELISTRAASTARSAATRQTPPAPEPAAPAVAAAATASPSEDAPPVEGPQDEVVVEPPASSKPKPKAPRERISAKAPGKPSPAKPSPQRTASPDTPESAKAPARASVAAGAQPAEGAVELPDAPTREQVIEAIAAVRSDLAQCAGGRRGVAQLDLNIANTGRVVHALVVGDFAGTEEGSCIARAVRKASFPRFKRSRFRILYPVSL